MRLCSEASQRVFTARRLGSVIIVLHMDMHSESTIDRSMDLVLDLRLIKT